MEMDNNSKSRGVENRNGGLNPQTAKIWRNLDEDLIRVDLEKCIYFPHKKKTLFTLSNYSSINQIMHDNLVTKSPTDK